jgi:hypothetical protein
MQPLLIEVPAAAEGSACGAHVSGYMFQEYTLFFVSGPDKRQHQTVNY